MLVGRRIGNRAMQMWVELYGFSDEGPDDHLSKMIFGVDQIFRNEKLKSEVASRLDRGVYENCPLSFATQLHMLCGVGAEEQVCLFAMVEYQARSKTGRNMATWWTVERVYVPIDVAFTFSHHEEMPFETKKAAMRRLDRVVGEETNLAEAEALWFTPKDAEKLPLEHIYRDYMVMLRGKEKREQELLEQELAASPITEMSTNKFAQAFQRRLKMRGGKG